MAAADNKSIDPIAKPPKSPETDWKYTNPDGLSKRTRQFSLWSGAVVTEDFRGLTRLSLAKCVHSLIRAAGLDITIYVTVAN